MEFKRGDVVFYRFNNEPNGIAAVKVVSRKVGRDKYVGFKTSNNYSRLDEEEGGEFSENGHVLIGKIPEANLPKNIKVSILPEEIQNKIDEGDFGCRRESVQALIEEVYKAVKA